MRHHLYGQMIIASHRPNPTERIGRRALEEMADGEKAVEDGEGLRKMRKKIADHSRLGSLLFDDLQKVAETKVKLSKQAEQTKEILSKQADKIAKRAEEHERFITKVTHLLGVLGFGGFCYILGARPQDVPYVYCLFYITFVPLRWIYYRYKKWHYYLLDFCYYANTFFLVMLLMFPKNEKLFMVCFSFAEGPLAWALIVWRCSLVFSSFDKIVSVLIHLLPGPQCIFLAKYTAYQAWGDEEPQNAALALEGRDRDTINDGACWWERNERYCSHLFVKRTECGIVFFTIRWWNPETFAAMHPVGRTARVSWPYVEDKSYLWTWLFLVPLIAYTLWQLLYFLIVNVLRRQRLLQDPEVMTSYRELSKKAQKANNIWWRLSGILGDHNRPMMYIMLQAIFTVATMALTVPIFLSYRMHVIFQVLKVTATIWNGGNFLVDVMPRQVILKEKKKQEMKPILELPPSSASSVLNNNEVNNVNKTS
ncbi:hypothetical protein IEQ34_010954 [Dendrobium chrysotoxum]|uniref:Glycerophosphocholine acyltransferase 1 n=1 Tax=Dendrobium chrysotoxum TaxID=161865 RepID=A0AAV7GU76_DENCH|nr:hypothetical protein IEQ34_010954 [Dendrobium chrysotoxum]